MSEIFLVTGAAGNIGVRVTRRLAREGMVIPTVHEYLPGGLLAERLDITDAYAVKRLIARVRPTVVVNLAALADANVCEKNPEQARAVNGEGAGTMARAAARAGAFFIHMSTDLVFDGEKGMYTEDDRADPLSVYGKTKLDGERAALGSGARGAVIRVGFTDEWRSFMYAEDAADAVAMVARARAAGVWHAAGPERMSRFEFTQALFTAMGLPHEALRPMAIADLPGQAPRPADCSLDSARLMRATGWRPQPVREAVTLFAAELPR
ncbi:MAG: SDR family oxidoreductase [Nitrospinae bacterium]|nr:SDR family oxidoreductase [Nitrospinota bacterium]